MRLDRIALRPVRAAARSGRDLLTDEAERAIDGVLAGPLPEHIARSLIENHVVERVVSELLATTPSGDGAAPEIERLAKEVASSPAVKRWVESPEVSQLAETVTARVVQSVAFKRAMTEVLGSPELRKALRQQTSGFGAEFAAASRTRMRSVDDAVAARVRRLFRVRPRAADAPFAGFATRGVALVMDAALAQVIFLTAAVSIGLVFSLVGSLHRGWLTGTFAAAGWLLVFALYFVGFWSGAGQTPGMRFMRLRVAMLDEKPLSPWRALLRLVGLILAIIPLFAGFLPVFFDARRRALQDFIAGTAVRYDDW